MDKEPLLLVPGPTPLSDAVASALSQPMISHRSKAFRELLPELRFGLARFHGRTKQEVLLLTCSATGAMEAAVTNLTEPGDSVMVVDGGRFGARWAAIAESHGCTVRSFTVRRGESADPDAVGAVLASLKPRCLFLTGVETSTGALTDVAAIAKHAPEGCLVVVDGVTWLGAHSLPAPEAMGIDLLVCASQKTLGCPPGVATVWVGERARERIAATQRGRYYFDLRRELGVQQKGYTGFTPAISTFRAMAAALHVIEMSGGVAALAQNAGRLATITREWAAAEGLELFAQQPADSLTVVRMPRGKGGRKLTSSLLLSRLLERGVVLADGQEELSGEVIRISHMGHVTEADTRKALTAVAAELAGLQ